jgi:preprotein translocase subunit YajC
MFSSTAYAQAAGSGPGGFDIMSVAPLVLIFVVFYFLLIRPQQKKMKDHKSMLGALRRGDKVVTGGGIVGTVVRPPEGEEVVVEIADGIKVRVVRGTIQSVLTRAEPAEKASGDDKKEEAKSAAEKK